MLARTDERVIWLGARMLSNSYNDYNWHACLHSHHQLRRLLMHSYSNFRIFFFSLTSFGMVRFAYALLLFMLAGGGEDVGGGAANSLIVHWM